MPRGHGTKFQEPPFARLLLDALLEYSSGAEGGGSSIFLGLRCRMCLHSPASNSAQDRGPGQNRPLLVPLPELHMFI